MIVNLFGRPCRCIQKVSPWIGGRVPSSVQNVHSSFVLKSTQTHGEPAIKLTISRLLNHCGISKGEKTCKKLEGTTN